MSDYVGDIMSCINIEPYTELELDCYQNLLVTLVSYYKYDVKYLGAIWPWQYVLLSQQNEFENSILRLRNVICASYERLKQFYGIKVNIVNYDDYSDAWEQIKAYLDKSIPVIVEVDQYYVHYHFPYIYKKQHGIYFVLLTGYNDSCTEAYCVDAIPYYKGMISVNELIEGMRSSAVDKKFYILDLPANKVDCGEDFVYSNLLDSLNQIKLSRSSSVSEVKLQKRIMLANDIICHINDWLIKKDDVELKEFIKILCDGTWGWEVERIGKWFAAYVQMPYVRSVFAGWEECVDLVSKNNYDWMVAFRLLFKGGQSKTRDMTYRALEKLTDIELREQRIISLFTE